MLQSEANTIVGYGTVLINGLVDVVPVGPLPLANPLANAPYAPATGPLFKDSDTYVDIQQGSVGNCGLMSGLAEVADKNPAAIRNFITDNSNGTYTIRYFDHNRLPATLLIDNQLPTSGYADYSRELWVALCEKALAIIYTLDWTPVGTVADYSVTVSSFPFQVFTAVCGVGAHIIPLGQLVFEQAWAAGSFLCFTSLHSGTASPNIIPNHAYAVVGYAAGLLTLWNPWGYQVTLNYSEVPGNFSQLNASVI